MEAERIDPAFYISWVGMGAHIEKNLPPGKMENAFPEKRKVLRGGDLPPSFGRIFD